MTDREHCGNCAFGITVWLHQSSEIRCHRRAPVVFQAEIGWTGANDGKPIIGEKTFWPKVGQDDFCGDWELGDAK